MNVYSCTTMRPQASYGSNVIPRRDRPGLAGLRPHNNAPSQASCSPNPRATRNRLAGRARSNTIAVHLLKDAWGSSRGGRRLTRHPFSTGKDGALVLWCFVLNPLRRPRYPKLLWCDKGKPRMSSPAHRKASPQVFSWCNEAPPLSFQ